MRDGHGMKYGEVCTLKIGDTQSFIMKDRYFVSFSPKGQVYEDIIEYSVHLHRRLEREQGDVNHTQLVGSWTLRVPEKATHDEFLQHLGRGIDTIVENAKRQSA